MCMNKQIVAALDGAAHAGNPSSYWAAQAFKNALRKRDSLERLAACRAALKQFSVTVWQVGKKIEIRKNAISVASFEVKP